MPTVVFSPEHTPPKLDPLYEAAARERLRALMTFAGGLAHDVRSPLTAIMGRAELIGIRQPELAEKMQAIAAQCDRVDAMLRAVSVTLELEAVTEPRPVDLTDLVKRQCDLLCLDRFFKHEIEKQFELATGLPSITAVYGTIARVFAAIVDNALAALRGSAQRRLVISTGTGEGAVRLSVRDSGCGIRPEHLPRIFEPGFTTREGDRFGAAPLEQTGRGNGLAFAATAVHGCGGTIEVTSEPGDGTAVTVTFPVR